MIRGVLLLLLIGACYVMADGGVYDSEDYDTTEAPTATTKAGSGSGTTKAGNNTIPSTWNLRGQCACFCFNRQGLVNPPPWIPGQAPPKGTKPTPVQPPANAPPGPTIFTDPVFLGGPPLWDADECRVRQNNEKQYDISFFCTCCCPK